MSSSNQSGSYPTGELEDLLRVYLPKQEPPPPQQQDTQSETSSMSSTTYNDCDVQTESAGKPDEPIN